MARYARRRSVCREHISLSLRPQGAERQAHPLAIIAVSSSARYFSLEPASILPAPEESATRESKMRASWCCRCGLYSGASALPKKQIEILRRTPKYRLIWCPRMHTQVRIRDSRVPEVHGATPLCQPETEKGQSDRAPGP